MWIKNTYARLFHAFFIVRRLLIIAALLFFVRQPSGQIFWFLLVSLVQLIYQVIIKPYDSILINRLETFNEVSILMLGYHLPCVSKFVTDPFILEKIGWSIICLLILNISANLSVIIWQAFRIGKLKLKAEMKRRQIAKQKKYHLAND